MFLIKIWNVYSFFVTYANLNEWSPSPNANFQTEHVLDKWILSRMTGSVRNMEKRIENYQAYLAMGQVEVFVNDLSNWYVRRSRDRFGKEADLKDREAALYTLWLILTEYSKVLAPFIPFVSEEIYTNLSTNHSVHLEDWPTFNSKWEDPVLEKEMEEAGLFAEEAHSQRKEKGIRVRQPLASMTATGPIQLSDQVKDVIAAEINVKKVIYIQGDEIKVELDTNLTQGLKDEGEARDIMRKIQEERKKLSTTPNDMINASLPSWPKEFEEEIKRKTLIKNLSTGEFKVSKV